jgi:hypothetical protein
LGDFKNYHRGYFPAVNNSGDVTISATRRNDVPLRYKMHKFTAVHRCSVQPWFTNRTRSHFFGISSFCSFKAVEQQHTLHTKRTALLSQGKRTSMLA